MPPSNLAIDIVTKAGRTNAATIMVLKEVVTGLAALERMKEANDWSNCFGK